MVSLAPQKRDVSSSAASVAATTAAAAVSTEALLSGLDDKAKADFLRRDAERKAAEADEARVHAQREVTNCCQFV